jgi:protein-L-isoaspartate(D-aspartate) O-methyltransferase
MTAFDFETARHNMIEQQIRPWEVLDQRVLDTLANTPREDFVPVSYRRLAFSDIAIPLNHGEYMMKPNLEARMLQALDVKLNDTVLEVGTGSGYITACLAQLTRKLVVSVEVVPEFTETARKKLKIQGLTNNVLLHTGDASQSWGINRYDVIAVTGSVSTITDHWRHSLSFGGRLFIVVGQPPAMEASLITRVDEHEWIQESLFETIITPLRNVTPIRNFIF